MKLFFQVLLLFLMSSAALADSLCSSLKTKSESFDFKKISQHISKNPVVEKKINGALLKANEIIKTKANEFTKISFEKPFYVEFDLSPNSVVELVHQSTKDCGPKIRLSTGKVKSTGNHPEVSSDAKAALCEYELETDEAWIQPLGTTYIAETGALSDALAELNGETPSGSQQNFSVERGTISVKLKKISKVKAKNKVKVVKIDKKKKSEKETKLAKNKKPIPKSKTKYLAYNEKIKLKAGASLKVKRNKKDKKTQTAELEIVDPWEN